MNRDAVPLSVTSHYHHYHKLAGFIENLILVLVAQCLLKILSWISNCRLHSRVFANISLTATSNLTLFSYLYKKVGKIL